MAKAEGTYIQIAYKNVFGHISTNSWFFFMIQRPTISGKCAWVKSSTWQDERPVFFRFFHFLTNLTTGDQKFSEFVQLQPVVWSFAVGFSSVLVFFQSSKLDLRTLPLWYTLFMGGGLVFIGRLIQLVEHPCLTLWVWSSGLIIQIRRLFVSLSPYVVKWSWWRKRILLELTK